MRIDVDDQFEDRATLQRIVTRLREQYPALKRWRLGSATRAWDYSILTFTNVDPAGVTEFGEGELEQQGGEFTARLAGSVTVDFRQLFLPVIGGADEQYTHLVEPFERLFALVEAFMSGAQRQFDIATASALSKA